jgi:cytochrome oxidase Cu insertion factor (SCO1/SenC/PrrC family)
MNWRLPILAITGLAIGGLAALLAFPSLIGGSPNSQSVGRALVGGPFTLTDHTGKRVTDQDFRGKHMLVMFGFTFCPDICPSGLQVMSAALDLLGPKADKIVPIFITIDPERDTTQALAAYVPSFHKRLIGFTGTAEEIAAVAKAYRVYYKRVKDEKSAAAYTMDHSALIYLMGPDGAYVAHFNHGTGAEALATRLAKLL